MINLYSPQNEIDLALLKGLLDSEGFNYAVIHKTAIKPGEPEMPYSLCDKIRMVIEVFVLGWIVPGRRNTKGQD